VSQPIKAEICPGGRIVGSIALCAIGRIAANARHLDARCDRESLIVTTVVVVIVCVVVTVIIGIVAAVAVAERAACR
jgi:hypothetical protein